MGTTQELHQLGEWRIRMQTGLHYHIFIHVVGHYLLKTNTMKTRERLLEDIAKKSVQALDEKGQLAPDYEHQEVVDIIIDEIRDIDLSEYEK